VKLKVTLTGGYFCGCLCASFSSLYVCEFCFKCLTSHGLLKRHQVSLSLLSAYLLIVLMSVLVWHQSVCGPCARVCVWSVSVCGLSLCMSLCWLSSVFVV